ncbi:MSMEG_0570 family nitrogen starvation response protein [Synechococcus sp. CS-1328]|uniref:MSMEG_0570 family nitrogen starvation response protein n=1 Tax=Synechococcus sp. CS-1328 TaxID=2847976 RepID=UPI00223BCA2A|nr:MSMEG_0570 family nitrogen starvation response protein [Synechococcus sp. CS-1328]MCT0224409.1 MSMEG_0570 family nitrogen starvation response protein [Synechococcus sp. CS-1328]
MPEVHLTLQWPDGLSSQLYSPSTVILEHLPPGEQLSVGEVQTRGLEGLKQASERVRARYGFACTRTDEEAMKLQHTLAAYRADQMVVIQSGD